MAFSAPPRVTMTVTTPSESEVWVEWLSKVDETSAPEPLRTEVATVCVANKVATTDLAGLAETDISALTGYDKLTMPARALLKRSLWTVNANFQQAKKPRGSASSADGSGPQMQLTTMQSPCKDMLGAEVTSQRLSAAMEACNTTVAVDELLKKVGLQNLQYSLLAEQHWFGVARAAVLKARQAGEAVPFMYMDLTASGVLPVWLSQDQIGGRLMLPGESDFTMDANSKMNSVSDLSRLFKQATDNPRYFRSWEQHQGAFLKMIIVLVSTEMLPWSTVMTYWGTLLKLAEEERGEGGHVSRFLTILYDDLQRKSWSHRSERKDPGLDIAVEAQKPQRTILEAARQRLGPVLKAANLQNRSPTQTSLGSSPESLLYSTTAAAESMRKRADDARVALERQQKLFEGKQLEILGAQGSGSDTTKGGGKGNKKGKHNGGNMSKQQIKAKAYFEKCKQWRQQQNGWKQSSGWHGS